ncbi:hypothetical protein pb186bvf_007786 [Paramecium bursaria]
MTSLSPTILGCGYNSFKIEISLIAVEGTPSSSFSNLIFFKATNSFVTESLALYTTPQVPKILNQIEKKQHTLSYFLYLFIPIELPIDFIISHIKLELLNSVIVKHFLFLIFYF